MLAVSGRGAGLLGARGGWAERERTGGGKGRWAAGVGRRRECWAGTGKRRGERGLGLGLVWAGILG